MIRFTSGDILRDDADALVNTVNCVGVTGRGIELQFKKAFPMNLEAYKKARQSGDIVPGKMFLTEQVNLEGPRFIVNCSDQTPYGGARCRVEDIESGLEAPRDAIKERNITSIAIPAPGSGLGGLNWSDVKTPWPHSR